jgi:hypothetical protein
MTIEKRPKLFREFGVGACLIRQTSKFGESFVLSINELLFLSQCNNSSLHLGASKRFKTR